MAKVFDEDHVHDFWGLSPGVDSLNLLESLPVSISQHGILERLAQADAVNILQVLSRKALQTRDKFTKPDSKTYVVDWCI